MKVLLLGSGGREHALAWKMAQSPLLSKLYIAPGNAGTALVGENVAMAYNDFQAIKTFVLENAVEMVVVGPEEPLVNGIRDFFETDDALQKVPVIGPVAKAAQLEGSKAFSKRFMQKYGIPTAAYLEVTIENIDEGIRFLEKQNAPYVLKADGLAAGKGVIITTALQEAKDTLRDILNGRFGKAGEKVVIEEFLSGIELSVFVITDGKDYRLLPEAKDYKRIGEGDTGLNTGGMGAVSPVNFADEAFMQKVKQQIIEPTIKGLQTEKLDYRGFIFFGLMNVAGNPFVIEYNVRMGDPETEVVIPRLKNDLLELLQATANGSLSQKKIAFLPETAVTVMLVSKGYPEAYEKGKAMYLPASTDSILFHAGTKTDGQAVLTNGGRVMAVTSLGKTMQEALNKSYETITTIEFEGKTFRQDIGQDLMAL
jgi:phosphoribosylamine--glycine ligase